MSSDRSRIEGEGEAAAEATSALRKVFGHLDDDALNEIVGQLEVLHLARGQVLYQQGDAALGLHVVLTGRLEVRVSAEAMHRLVGHIDRGQTVGEIGLFMGVEGGARSATVRVVRDATLGFLSRDVFQNIVRRHPQASEHLARFIVKRLTDAQSRGRTSTPTVRNIVLMPLTPGFAIREFAERLQIAFLRQGRTALLTEERARARFKDALLPGHPSRLQLDNFLDQIERDHDFVLLLCGAEPSPWNTKCLAHADQVVFVSPRGLDPGEAKARLARIDEALTEPRPSRMFVTAHPRRSEAPQGTGAFLRAVGAGMHLHVALEGNEGVNRLARVLTGHAVTLVLSGGGARGFAHLGVLRALREAGVPVDAVGGASFGALVAGNIARGLADNQILDEFKRAFADEHPMDDYTLPVLSLVRGEKMTRSLRHFLGETEIEDLWLPFFAVSSNLSRNVEKIHTTGPLWRAMRATVSLPAIFPPVIEDGDLLVDGGILNNLPLEIMRRTVPGRAIAVDLSALNDYRYDIDSLPTAWEYLRRRLFDGSEQATLPVLHSVVMRATTLGSRREVEIARRDADLFLNPPVAGFDMLDWSRFHAIVDVGYVYARERLTPFIATHRDFVARDEVFDSRRVRVA
ncbi:MAG: patatin-like phospholipase family protein [Vicinamibacteria bacterium]